MPFEIKIKNVLKIFAFCIVILIFDFWILNFFCYAAPCYGTNLPKKNKFQAGLGSYSVFKRYLADQAGKLRSQQQFVLFSYGVFEWLSLDLKGGAGYIKQRPVNGEEIYYHTFMGGGYGFRLKFYDRKRARLVFGFQHISIHPQTAQIGGVKHKAVSDDWQLSLLGSYSLKRIVPYLGTRVSRYDYIHWQNGERNRQKSDLTRSIGLIYGCDLPVTEKIWANLEGSSFDSEAFSFSLNYNF
ncbi:MAG: hypothetical protein A3G38_00465 [Omnitrophica WOR_2 bacterium RIFCSPLOWO2_12_FULL_51_8]|nr:MAG: hypothetical protein A3G38_00465 [Omnitrophica WOR_2 bacterium RIFCSPLOWO2_12_FULL_51_8]